MGQSFGWWRSGFMGAWNIAFEQCPRYVVNNLYIILCRLRYCIGHWQMHDGRIQSSIHRAGRSGMASWCNACTVQLGSKTLQEVHFGNPLHCYFWFSVLFIAIAIIHVICHQIWCVGFPFYWWSNTIEIINSAIYFHVYFCLIKHRSLQVIVVTAVSFRARAPVAMKVGVKTSPLISEKNPWGSI